MSFRTSTTLPDKAAPDQESAVTTPPPHSGQPSFAFPHSHRVTRGPEIEQVRKEGKRVRTASMDVRAVASLHACGRVGIIVPKYGHGSVGRNKVKRRLRELVRVETLPVMPALDVVVRVAPRAYERPFDELREEVRKWTRQLIAQSHIAQSPIARSLIAQPSTMKPLSELAEPSPGASA